MALSVFDSGRAAPKPAELAVTLGRSAPHWESLIAWSGEAHAPIREVWKDAGAKFGWSLRLVRGERVVLYLIPQAGHFLVGVVLGVAAEAAARKRGLPQPVLDLLDAAPRYAEGRGIRVPVRTRAGLAAIRVLVDAKLAK